MTHWTGIRLVFLTPGIGHIKNVAIELSPSFVPLQADLRFVLSSFAYLYSNWCTHVYNATSFCMEQSKCMCKHPMFFVNHLQLWFRVYSYVCKTVCYIYIFIVCSQYSYRTVINWYFVERFQDTFQNGWCFGIWLLNSSSLLCITRLIFFLQEMVVGLNN